MTEHKNALVSLRAIRDHVSAGFPSRSLLALSCALLPLAMFASAAQTDTRNRASSTDSTMTAKTVAAAVTESWQPQPFARYEEIIGRAPFGKPPPAPPPNAAERTAPPPPPPAFVNQLVLSTVNRRPGGKVAVGFTDNSQKPPRSYYLDVGDENGDGFKAVWADYDQSSATISKDGTDVTLKMGKGPATNAPAGPVPATAPPSPIAIMPVRAAMPAQTTSFAARLAALRAQAVLNSAISHPPPENQPAKERFSERMREYNLNRIRQGQQPTGPIALTPEEDAQLVKEGVLPAQH